ncbi:AAA-ATPase ASD, mitochondrial-like isoform X4 [Rhododendron vialii]|uniref:AAA-ATPase ASD, mitochondrial-like isoform X4 n=1 Tax=Rhododendron vialii TaxID=182163 RepID=UPI0026600835|nr:AAA-ATPase ASD, mitochondrial-like isoform X4 [Rhododendron vialii]
MESEIDRNKLLYICSIIGEGKTRIKNCWPNVCLGHNSTVLPIPALSLYRKLSDKLVGIVYPYVQITIHEHTRGRHNEVYAAIESYLGAKSTVQARRLKADMVKNSKSFVLSLDKSEWRSQMSSKVSWKKKGRPSSSKTVNGSFTRTSRAISGTGMGSIYGIT